MPWSAIADAAPATVADRILLTLVGFPRRPVSAEILATARRRARWQRAKMLYRVMRGMTGILVRLTFYGLAYRLTCAVRGGPFRRDRAAAAPPLKDGVVHRTPALSRDVLHEDDERAAALARYSPFLEGGVIELPRRSP